MGIALSTQTARLGTGVLDKLLFAASRRVDGYCHKRIQALGSTTVGSGGILAGNTLLPVASTLTFDNLAEQAVLLGTGGTQELLPLVPGGVQVTSFVYPYPGTLTLAVPCLYAHSAGESLQGMYQEIEEAGSSSSSDIYSDAYTQEAQIALAHAPMIGRGTNLTRLVFVKNYPIISVSRVEHSYPFSSGYASLDTNAITIEPTAGYYRLSLGSIVLPQGMLRTTYQAGYQNIPDDIKQATSYYLAAELQVFFNLQGGMEQSQGKHRIKYSDGKTVSQWAAMAEEILCDGNYVRKT